MSKKPTKKRTRKRRTVSKSLVNTYVRKIKDDILIPTRGSLVSLFIPAVTEAGQEQFDLQRTWSLRALELFSDHFRGATLYNTHCGMYKKTNGDYQKETTHVVQSIADRSALHDENNLSEIVAFCERMRQDLEQESVLLAIDSVAHFIQP